MAARLSAPWRFLILTLGLSLAGLAAPACAQTQPLMVYAAASLKNALDDIAKDWTASGHGSVAINYAASSTLAQQIAADAPADLFVSADLDWMDCLQARGKLREGQRRVLLGNELVLITSASSPLTLRLEKASPCPKPWRADASPSPISEWCPQANMAKQPLNTWACGIKSPPPLLPLNMSGRF